MRDNLENQDAQERMGRRIVILMVIGALAVVGVIGWALRALWRVLT